MLTGVEDVFKTYRILVKSINVILSVIILLLIPSFAMAVEGPITIDGYYDDWSDKPHTPISHGGWNGKDVHSIALFLDGDRLYVHVKMNDEFGTQFKPNSMRLSINDKNNKLQFMLGNINADNTINWGGNINNLPLGTTLGLGVFNDKSKTWLGDAAITVTDPQNKKGDEAEFFIDLESARSAFNNISVDEMRTFTLSCPNIGKEDVTITGTSTAPYIGLALALAVVAFSALFRRKRTDGKII